MSPPARVVWIEILKRQHQDNFLMSPPARVVWIEIVSVSNGGTGKTVATREGGVD